MSLKEFGDIFPILKKITKGEDYNWENKEEYLSEEEIDNISSYIPSGGDNGVHTIVEISAWFLSKSDSIRYKIKL